MLLAVVGPELKAILQLRKSIVLVHQRKYTDSINSTRWWVHRTFRRLPVSSWSIACLTTPNKLWLATAVAFPYPANDPEGVANCTASEMLVFDIFSSVCLVKSL